jgi:hypothetical protein
MCSCLHRSPAVRLGGIVYWKFEVKRKCISGLNFLEQDVNQKSSLGAIWNFINEQGSTESLLDYGAYVNWDSKRSKPNCILSLNPK